MHESYYASTVVVVWSGLVVVLLLLLLLIIDGCVAVTSLAVQHTRHAAV